MAKKKKKKSRSSNSKPTFFLFSQVGLRYPTRKGVVSFIAMFPEPRREWQPTPVFLPGESHGQRSLVGYS